MRPKTTPVQLPALNNQPQVPLLTAQNIETCDPFFNPPPFILDQAFPNAQPIQQNEECNTTSSIFGCPKPTMVWTDLLKLFQQDLRTQEFYPFALSYCIHWPSTSFINVLETLALQQSRHTQLYVFTFNQQTPFHKTNFIIVKSLQPCAIKRLYLLSEIPLNSAIYGPHIYAALRITKEKIETRFLKISILLSQEFKTEMVYTARVLNTLNTPALEYTSLHSKTEKNIKLMGTSCDRRITNFQAIDFPVFEGDTLRNILLRIFCKHPRRFSSTQNIPIYMAINFTLLLLCSLYRLHHERLEHRNLNPENIGYVLSSNEIRFFGLHEAGAFGKMFKKKFYKVDSIYRTAYSYYKKPITGQADIFALGMIMAEIHGNDYLRYFRQQLPTIDAIIYKITMPPISSPDFHKKFLRLKKQLSKLKESIVLNKIFYDIKQYKNDLEILCQSASVLQNYHESLQENYMNAFHSLLNKTEELLTHQHHTTTEKTLNRLVSSTLNAYQVESTPYTKDYLSTLIPLIHSMFLKMPETKDTIKKHQQAFSMLTYQPDIFQILQLYVFLLIKIEQTYNISLINSALINSHPVLKILIDLKNEIFSYYKTEHVPSVTL